VNNVSLVQSDDELSQISESYDFVHTYIVLQHIPVERGEKLVRKLASRLAPGGVGMFQVPYTGGRARALGSLIYWLRLNVPGAKAVLNLAKGRDLRAPVMQMNEYSVTRLLDILRSEGCGEAHIRFSDHGGARGVLIFARRTPAEMFD
jgi:2-polyprenyl-3-methyl-5-hydroxy-6-metoxy-1,4-benzoquinol methylase